MSIVLGTENIVKTGTITRPDCGLIEREVAMSPSWLREGGGPLKTASDNRFRTQWPQVRSSRLALFPAGQAMNRRWPRAATAPSGGPSGAPHVGHSGAPLDRRATV